ncbi:shikimate kinase [Sungkyunkwania multivorans]|uniref:Shikimate kinase n=1 Tax=Sungkyunkwania multivorans TaxID=1173618 RepID=A0ABW3CTY2_9FLAO
MIILIGYMGSGKSSVGKVLAQKIQRDFVDLDAYIEEKEQRTISEIFETDGEIKFRMLEHRYLKELLEAIPNCVLSLGGGTPCYAGNMELIAHYGVPTFYLKASIPNLTDRLWGERKSRPLIKYQESKEQLMEFIGKHLFERHPYYSKAGVTILVDGRSIEEIATEIAEITLA